MNLYLYDEKKKKMKEKNPSLTHLRLLCGISQEQLALLCGVDRTHLAHWQAGRRTLPAAAKKKLANLLMLLTQSNSTAKKKHREMLADDEARATTVMRGKLFQLTEELERQRKRRDELERNYHARLELFAQLSTSIPRDEISRGFHQLALKSIHEWMRKESFEELVRLRLVVETLEFQVGWLRARNEKRAEGQNAHSLGVKVRKPITKNASKNVRQAEEVGVEFS
jgi:transcriptional regulator with XRE-family HTH domain